MTYDPETHRLAITRAVVGDRDLSVHWTINVAAIDADGVGIDCNDNGETTFAPYYPPKLVDGTVKPGAAKMADTWRLMEDHPWPSA